MRGNNGKRSKNMSWGAAKDRTKNTKKWSEVIWQWVKIRIFFDGHVSDVNPHQVEMTAEHHTSSLFEQQFSGICNGNQVWFSHRFSSGWLRNGAPVHRWFISHDGS
jgi:hypothetical protein